MAVSHQAAYLSNDDVTASRDASSPQAAIAAAVRDAAARGTVAVGLGAIAVIHAVDAVGKWSEARYMFWMYMALIVAALITAAAVLFERSRVPFAVAAALAASVLAAFVIDRTIGLPNATGDVGNWTEPLGLCSLLVESFVVAIGAAGYLGRARPGDPA